MFALAHPVCSPTQTSTFATLMNGNVSQPEFHELSDAAFAPLFDHGFRHYKQLDSAYSLFSNRVAIRVTSGDRMGSVETELKMYGTELHTAVSCLAPYLNKLDHTAYKFSQLNNADSARRALDSHVDFLTQHCSPWLVGLLIALQQFCEFQYVDNGLNTQQFTDDARPAEKWDLVKSAWNRQRWAAFVRMVGGFTPPLTEYEQKAIAYAEKRRTM